MIYFLRCEQHTAVLRPGWIKIGTTIRLSERLKQVAAEHFHTPTVLAVLDGGFAEERALHLKFKEARKHREWFEPHPELLLLIETEGRQWGGEDEVPDMTVKIDRVIGIKAKMVAAARKITLSEYLSDLAGALVDQDFAEEMRNVEKGALDS